MSDAERRAEQEREQKLGAHLVPGTPLVFLENPGNPEDLEKIKHTIDLLTEWQVEHIIDAEATVRREMARVGSEYRKAIIGGESEDDLMALKSRLDALVDELQNIRGRSERYEQGVIDEYSVMRNITRAWEGMKERVANGDRLTKKEVELLYRPPSDLKKILNDDLYREICLARNSREREKGKGKEDYAVLYDCEEDQIVLYRDRDDISQIFLGGIVYCDFSFGV